MHKAYGIQPNADNGLHLQVSRCRFLAIVCLFEKSSKVRARFDMLENCNKYHGTFFFLSSCGG